jgi:hypothetical protein
MLYDLHFPSVSLLFALYDDTYLAQRARDFGMASWTETAGLLAIYAVVRG